MKTILALALGTYCGWARVEVTDQCGTAWSHGTWTCSGTTSARLKTFRHYLDQQLALGVNKLFVHGRKGKMFTLVSEVCTAHGVPCEPLNIVQVRQFATGSGRADTAALAAVTRKWGSVPDSANAAMAIASLRWVWEEGA